MRGLAPTPKWIAFFDVVATVMVENSGGLDEWHSNWVVFSF